MKQNTNFEYKELYW